jgi:glycosyltransferase involved in cell wall biosynthesis
MKNSRGLKIRHFTTYPNQGGAGIAAWRLVHGLRTRGLDADLVGIWKFGITDLPGQENFQYDRDPFHRAWRVFRRFQVDRVNKKLPPASSRDGLPFYSDFSPLGQPMLESALEANIIHLHWVCDFIDYEYFFSRLPSGVRIFWTLHDMNPFTGGCIHSMGCQRFETACGQCPLLESESPADESARILERKILAIKPLISNLCVITPSHWLGNLACRSRVFSGAEFRVIPNGVDLEIYHPRERDRGRKLMGVDGGEKVVLFVAASLRQSLKGGPLLIEVCKELQTRGIPFQVVCVGEATGFQYPEGWRILNFTEEEVEKAAVFAAADVLVVPSVVENYPNVICEALACGVPVVGSRVGGITELVENGVTGYTPGERNAASFADALQSLLETLPGHRSAWSQRCREFAKKTFSMDEIEARHIELYEKAGTTRETALK